MYTKMQFLLGICVQYHQKTYSQLCSIVAFLSKESKGVRQNYV